MEDKFSPPPLYYYVQFATFFPSTEYLVDSQITNQIEAVLPSLDADYISHKVVMPYNLVNDFERVIATAMP